MCDLWMGMSRGPLPSLFGQARDAVFIRRCWKELMPLLVALDCRSIGCTSHGPTTDWNRLATVTSSLI